MMDDRDKRQERAAMFWGWSSFAALLILLYASCNGLTAAKASDGPFSPGDTLWFAIVGLDSVGVEQLPDTVTVAMSKGDEVLDVLTYPPEGDLEQVGSLAWLRGSYVIPSTWTHPWTLEVAAYGTVDGFPYGLLISDPPRARVNARSAWVGTVDSSGVTATLTEAFPDSIRAVGLTYELDEEITGGTFDGGYIDSVGIVLLLDEEIIASSTVDSIAPSATNDLFAGLASAVSTYINQDSCDDCVLTVSGSPVSDGYVYVWSDSLATALDGRLRGFTPFVTAGNWSAQVRLEPGVPDTMWVRFFRQGAFLPDAHRVVIP